MRTGIIDYGVGNIGSIERAVEQVGGTPMLVNRAVDLHGHDAIILPGVGNFTECMNILKQNGWVDAIRDEVAVYGRPLLGICLGMQLLADFGSEGANPGGAGSVGLGLIPGRVISLQDLGCPLRVPHVGWNNTSIQLHGGKCHKLFDGVPEGTDFYYVHSYAFVPARSTDIIATANYGVDFVSAIGRNKVVGTQFHPEKSSLSGFQVLKNFLFG